MVLILERTDEPLPSDNPLTRDVNLALAKAASNHFVNPYELPAKHEIPVFIEENCTQCMACITVCPDTAVPNTAQDISTVLETAIRCYISDAGSKKGLLAKVPDIESACRAKMLELSKDKSNYVRFKSLVIDEMRALLSDGIAAEAVDQMENQDYLAQKKLLTKIDSNELTVADFVAACQTKRQAEDAAGDVF